MSLSRVITEKAGLCLLSYVKTSFLLMKEMAAIRVENASRSPARGRGCGKDVDPQGERSSLREAESISRSNMLPMPEHGARGMDRCLWLAYGGASGGIGLACQSLWTSKPGKLIPDDLDFAQKE